MISFVLTSWIIKEFENLSTKHASKKQDGGNKMSAFQKQADSKIQSSTDKRVFRYRQSIVWRLLPASD